MDGSSNGDKRKSLVPQNFLSHQVTRTTTTIPPTIRILTLTGLARLPLGRRQRPMPLLRRAAK
jgi:hypothetical protein